MTCGGPNMDQSRTWQIPTHAAVGDNGSRPTQIHSLAHTANPNDEVIGVDFSERMLALAREKATARARVTSSPVEVSIEFAAGNAMALPYADDEFDAATVGFGARNFADLGQGLAEMARVVRPGGRVVVLEITTPSKPPLH